MRNVPKLLRCDRVGNFRYRSGIAQIRQPLDLKTPGRNRYIGRNCIVYPMAPTSLHGYGCNGQNTAIGRSSND